MKTFWKTYVLNGGLTLFSILFTLIVAELLFRAASTWFVPGEGGKIKVYQTAVEKSIESPLFAPHPYLSYYPANISIGSVTCSIRGESFHLQKPPNTLRIACLGGSTTMQAYPIYLANSLKPCLPKSMSIEVMDWGCSGWTIEESLINYMIRARLFKPDIVILHHGINDLAPRVRRTYRLDYSHYRRSFDFEEISPFQRFLNKSWLYTWLQIRMGNHIASLDRWTVKPVEPSQIINPNQPIDPNSVSTYNFATEGIGNAVKADGGKLVLAGMIYHVTQTLPKKWVPIIEEHNRIFQTYAEQNSSLYVDTQSHFQYHKSLFKDASHLKAIGDQMKSNLFASAVARVFNVKPGIWIADDVTSSDMLKDDADHDPANQRKLAIHWNLNSKNAQELLIWVSVDGQKEALLARITNTDQTHLIWEARASSIQDAFRNGPQFGHSYRFSLWPKGKKPAAPLLMVNAVKFEKE